MMGYGTQTDDRNSAHHDYQGRGADLMPRLFVANFRPSFIYFLYILCVLTDATILKLHVWVHCPGSC